MKNFRQWKELSRAKNIKKDKWHHRTLEVTELLKECSEDKINIVKEVSKNDNTNNNGKYN